MLINCCVPSGLVGKCFKMGTWPLGNTKDIQYERLRIDRELLCAILKFETLKTIKSDSMDEQAGLGLGFAIIV